MGKRKATYKSYHVFDYKAQYFLFDIFNMECVEIDKNTFDGLRENGKSVLNQDIKSIFEIFQEKGLFFYNVDDICFESNATNTIFFSLAPITKCNLKCKYCFASSGANYDDKPHRFSSQTAIDVVNYLLQKFPNAVRYRLDFVSGGEPLLDFETTKQIIDDIKKVFCDNNKELDIWLCTNGTLISDDILLWLNKNNIQIGVSLDGDQTVNDICRVYPDGESSYDDVITGIKKIKDNVDVSNNLKYLWGLSVITSQTPSLVDVLNHHKKLGFKNIQMKFVRLPKNNSLSFTERNIQNAYKIIDDFIDYIEDVLKSHEYDTAIMFINENDHIGKLFNRLILKKPYIYRCYAGKQKFSFAPNGDIYPCDSFVGNEKYKIGNIYSEKINYELIKKFEELSVLNRDKCKNCWARFVCGGDCFHNSFSANGQINTPDPIFCKITKHTIIKILSSINNLYEVDLDIVLYLRKMLRVRSRIM